MPRKKSKNKYYFTEITEKAIVDYCNTESLAKRTKLYVEHIQPAFDELVNKIVYTYKFTSLENIEYHKDDCKIWLTTILGKFDPSKNKKAFSYFSVVTKNWFTHKAKKQTKKNRREVNYDEMVREVEAVSSSGTGNLMTEIEEREFWMSLLTEINSWQNLKLKLNEEKVLNAVITLMENIEQIEIFNKKAVYLYMREITDLNTKQIVSALNKMREKYRTFKKKWNEGEISQHSIYCMKKDLNSLIEQALENINKDRQETEILLDNLKEYMSVSKDRYSDSGPTAAKFVETLQRSNEQLVKLATLVYKKDLASNQTGLTDDDKNQLFDILKEEQDV